ncbi:SRPBCC family protein [Arthrobacter psychrolactophilus]
MAHAENRVTIHSTPLEIFAFLADGTNNPLWRTGIKAISLKSGQPGTVGVIYSQTLTGPGGRSIAGDYEITAAVPGELLSFQVVAGPARPAGEYRITATEGGAELQFSLDIQPSGLMKLVSGMITKTMATEVAQLSTLKRVLEAG